MSLPIRHSWRLARAAASGSMAAAILLLSTVAIAQPVFVDVTAKSGLFTWIALRLTKASRGDPLILLIAYGSMTVVFSAVLNNVTAMIIVGSLTGVSLRRLGSSDKLLGFLLIEGLLTNVGGLLTLISSVPNIIVGNAAGISFATFFVKAAPYVAVTTTVTIAMGARLFGIRRLAGEEGIGIMLIEHAIELVMAGSDVIVVLSSGEVIAEGMPEEIRQNREVLEAYLGHA